MPKSLHKVRQAVKSLGVTVAVLTVKEESLN